MSLVQNQDLASGSIAVLTSGGDCQGMNSVLYGLAFRFAADSVLKTNENSEPQSTSKNELYLILNGYQGLIDGGPDSIVKADTKILQRYLYQGGTMIGSSRCREFYHQDGRRKAAMNLLKHNVQNLVVIGGDGSLTGANLLRKEWSQYVGELIQHGQLDPKMSNSQLYIVGIIGSIDNDFFGTEMTIGVDSALNRVVESIDTVKNTAKSHGRVMVVEVMGRNCGYLAISSALGTEATYVFIPESPHKSTDEWKQKLQARINFERQNGQYFHIIIVSEGACDQNGQRIKSNTIKDFLCNECHLEARVVILGHLQRGGFTSLFDHMMSMQMGIEAYNLLQQRLPGAMILTINQDQIQAKPLIYCIDEMSKLSKYIKEKNWSKVIEQRGRNFINTWENFRNLMSKPNKTKKSIDTWAIVIQCQEPVPGMNALTFALVRYGYARNISVIGFRNGLEGLVENDVFRFEEWQSVFGWTSLSGCVLGSQCPITVTSINDKNIVKIIENFQENHIRSICFIGDHFAYNACRQLYEYRTKFSYLMQLKCCYVPVSLSETIPSSSLSSVQIPWSKLGRDSVLNKLMRLIIDLTNSSIGTYNRLYLIKINLNVLSTVAFSEPGLFSLVVGASAVYPFQKCSLKQTTFDENIVKKNALDLRNIINLTRENKFVLIHETFWTKVIDIYENVMNVEHNNSHQQKIQIHQIDLTSIQQPSMVTPFDRKLGVKLGMECGRYFSNENDTSTTTTPIIINTPFLFESKPINIII